MKMKKGTVLASMTIIVLASVLTTAGTMAYFSDIESSTGNTFTSGTLDLQITDGDEGWKDGTAVTASFETPDNWAPGETYTSEFKLRNVGNMDIDFLHFAFRNLDCSDVSTTDAEAEADPDMNMNNIATQIEVVEWKEYIPGYGWMIP